MGLGQLAILAWVPEAEVSSTLKTTRVQTIFFLVACFFFFLGAGYLVITKKGIGLPETSSSQAQTQSEGEQDPQTKEPMRTQVTVLHGSLRHINHLIESANPADAADALNSFFSLAASVVKEYRGIFEKSSERSFIAVWGAPTSDGSEIWRALRCALDIRKQFFNMNEARKVDGQKPLSFGMGIHSGMGLMARLGSGRKLAYSVAGEVVSCARSLDEISVSVGVDLLISQDTWQQSEARFMGEPLGEVKLTVDTGLTGIYSISGYRDEKGQVVDVAPLTDPEAPGLQDEGAPKVILRDKKALKWLVNNGSQIVGPLDSKEIALRLFAQELDFDCECWEEGTGTSSQIKDAGVFSGSDDKGAFLWVFDGETIHGPISPGFLKTAISHGAILIEQAFYCENSTIQGWRPLSTWDSNQPASGGSSSPPEDRLRASLAPPSGSISNRKEQSTDPQNPLKKVA